MRRRDVLILGGIIGVAVAIPPILRRENDAFEFSDLPGLPGFRRLERGNLSGSPDFFAGLQTPQEIAATKRLPDDLCTAIFPRGITPGRVPIAVFSDYYCPYCAILDKRVADMQADGALIDLNFHELPLLGERSRWAARVALAASDQGNHTAIHLDMMQRVLRPGSAGVRDMASRFNLDARRIMADAQSAQMDRRIEDALALGRVLGIPGTPGVFIGRTLIIGTLPQQDLSRLVEMEAGFMGCG